MTGFIRQSFAAFAGSICLIGYGMAYAWVSPVLNRLTDSEGDIRATNEQISWIAVDIEFGCLLTPFLASYLMDKFGRKWPMLCSVPLLITSWILTLTTRSVPVLYVKRVLDGMGLGLMQTIVPVYLAEIAEANIRGSVLNSVNIAWYGGALVQFYIGTYLSYNAAAWLNLAIPFVYFILFSFLPESPYYLMMKMQRPQAAKALAWFRGISPDEVDEELNCIENYLESDCENKESWTAAWNNKVYRKCFSIMVVVILATIMTGLTTIFSYATEMFADTYSDGILNPDSCSLAIAVIFVFVSVVISFTIDRAGRRPLVIVSSFGCFLSSVSSAYFSYFKNEFSYNWIPFVNVGSYCFFVSAGLIPVMFAYQGELFPPSIKNIASGMTTFFITLTSLVAVKLYYIIGSTVGVYVNYIIYASVAGFATLWLYFHAIETRNKTFNELYKELDCSYVKEISVINPEEFQILQSQCGKSCVHASPTKPCLSCSHSYSTCNTSV